MKTYFDINYFKNCCLDIYVPDSLLPKATVVYIHGGGLVEGVKRNEHIERFGKALTDENYAFVSVDYNLYPNAKFPSYIEECGRSIKFIIDNFDKYKLSRNIYISGSSAGAYITMMLCMNKNYFVNIGINRSFIKGWISDDGQMTDHFNVQKFEKNIDPWIQRISEISPLYYVDENVDISRLLLIYYDDDMPMRKEQNLLLYKTLKHFKSNCDVEIIEMTGTHCEGTCKPENDGSYRFIKVLLDWIK